MNSSEGKNFIVLSSAVAATVIGAISGDQWMRKFAHPKSHEAKVSIESIEHKIETTTFQSNREHALTLFMQQKNHWEEQKRKWNEVPLSFATTAQELGWSVRITRLDMTFTLVESQIYKMGNEPVYMWGSMPFGGL